MAGCTVRTFDLAAEFGMVDWTEVACALDTDCLAVVVPHLFGVPVDITPLVDTCARLGVRIVEDCAQTVGGTVNGVPAGAIGDAAIFSFGYDKPLSLGGGGLLLSAESGPPPPAGSAVVDRQTLRRLTEFLAVRRSMIPVGACLADPDERSRHYEQAADFATPGPIGPVRAALGLWQLVHYDAVVAERGWRARAVAATPGITCWGVAAGVQPAWLKQKVLVPNDPDGLAVRLQRDGLRAGRFNWHRPVVDPADPSDRPYAARATKTAVDVPIHQHVDHAELTHMISTIREWNTDHVCPD